jgi:hypothetical protein
MDERSIHDIESERRLMHEACYAPRITGIDASYAYQRYNELGKLLPQVQLSVNGLPAESR